MAESKTNPSLQKKSAARVMAVQSLYQSAINKEKKSTSTQISVLKAQLADNRSEQKLLTGMATEPNYGFLEQLLEGIGEYESQIDARLDSALDKDWQRERMSPILVAILQCAIFELFFFKDTQPKIVIDEYSRLTRSFFAEGEVNFVHGALSALSQKFHG